MLAGQDVATHNTQDSCWIVVHGEAYDVTNFLSSHPGGSSIILRQGGQDASEVYDSVHPPGLIEKTLPVSARLGAVDISTLPKGKSETPKPTTQKPNPNQMINLNDFEIAAEKLASESTWAYWASAADDEISKRQNEKDFRKVTLRPRILRDVAEIDTSTTILGKRTSMPVFVAPTGINKLAHPRGECEITIAAGKDGIVQVVSTGASMSIESICKARVNKEQSICFQLYVNKDISKSIDLIRKAEKAGVTSIWLTVDSPVLGNREMDDRIKAKENDGLPSSGGVAKASTSWITSSLKWEDLKWIRETTSLPLVIKGIQSVEDAVLAYEHGVQGIVISNHGGRSQDTAQSPLITLLEIRKYAPSLIGGKMEIYLDGGIRRGTDVLKAIALGATAVGLGRAYLHALAVGGEDGVRRLNAIIKEEFRTNMALAGAVKVKDISPHMVNTSRLEKCVTGSVKL